MRILALIPARAGSKRLPGKNIRLLAGRPLIAWSIDAAKGFSEICDIVVSTDDADIAEAARSAQARVPWLRPPELATDSSSSVDVALHALDWYEREMGGVDGLLLLQPTSPFRTRESMTRGIELFRAGQRPVVGVSPAASHPMWCFRIEGEIMRAFSEGGGVSMRAQELSPAFAVNGAFYLISPADLRARRSFFDAETVPLVMNEPEESVDIDTEWDWKIAEAVIGDRSRASGF